MKICKHCGGIDHYWNERPACEAAVMLGCPPRPGWTCPYCGVRIAGDNGTAKARHLHDVHMKAAA
jgi:hypothetical protein